MCLCRVCVHSMHCKRIEEKRKNHNKTDKKVLCTIDSKKTSANSSERKSALSVLKPFQQTRSNRKQIKQQHLTLDANRETDFDLLTLQLKVILNGLFHFFNFSLFWSVTFLHIFLAQEELSAYLLNFVPHQQTFFCLCVLPLVFSLSIIVEATLEEAILQTTIDQLQSHTCRLVFLFTLTDWYVYLFSHTHTLYQSIIFICIYMLA